MANAPQYDQAAARADKMLEPDGSITTHSGTVVSGPNPSLATAYSQATARADKLLQPDGSITTSGSGTGGSTPPGGASGQVQYNNAGVFSGASGLSTDGIALNPNANTAIGYDVAPIQLLQVGAGSNSYFEVRAPVGTYTAGYQFYIRPAGASGPAVLAVGAGAYNFQVPAGQSVGIGYSGAGPATLLVNSVASTANYIQIYGATAGNAPNITAQGSDANVNLNHTTKGNGVFVIQPGAAAANTNVLQINKSTGAFAASIQVNESGNTATLYLGGSTIGIQGNSTSSTVTANGHFTTTGGYSLQATPTVGSAVALMVTNTAATVTGNYVQVTTQGQPAGDILKVDGTGKTTLKQAILTLANVPVYANNAAATTGGLTAGMLYRTGADPDQLCIVH